MRNEKGVTLLEVVLATAIALVLLTVAYNMLFVGVRSHSTSVKIFEEQSDMRYTAETINNTLRFASVAFAVPEEQFAPQLDHAGRITGLAKPWNYIGLSPDGDSLVHYEYHNETDSYKMNVLAQPKGDLTYQLNFRKTSESQEDKNIKYFLRGIDNGREKFEISTEVEALNALHVIDWGDESNMSVALAYRTEETPKIHERPVAAMTMVLDTSGSMNDDLDGNSPREQEKSRIEILKETLKRMFSVMENNGGENIYARLVPFHANANSPHPNYNKDPERFNKVRDDNVNWNNLIDNLSADNGTNTGDGMRRGYYHLLDFNNNLGNYGLTDDTEVENYMVIMVDGVSTMASADVWWRRRHGYGYSDYILDDGNISKNTPTYSNWSGKGGHWERSPSQVPNPSNWWNYQGRWHIGDGMGLCTLATKYVDRVGEDLIQAKDPAAEDLGLDGNIFVIGFSNLDEDLESVKDIAKAVGIEVAEDNSDVENDFVYNDRVFIARDGDKLDEIFRNIAGYISEDLWQIEGPRITE
ncbi:prepilin-type N-terminal cleavage/methylation domain-containing protein [Proteinivorax hydrogeniformans]|uniref:Prepilin-type N-terminal cleavage/methylation domain-containing protein n=1 Tax=Proteinivorax hydrogeniformans TaxID=1826727 RepID=A0AAU8HSH7_9FIRM